MFLGLIVTSLMLSILAQPYSAFGQFSTVLEDSDNNNNTPASPPSTDVGDISVPPSTAVTTFVDDTGLTIGYVPPGWTVIDHDNTSPRAMEIIQNWRKAGDDRPADAVDLCPPYSKGEQSEFLSDSSHVTYYCTFPEAGMVSVSYFPNMDEDSRFLARATERDPQTGLFIMTRNLTAQDVMDRGIRATYDYDVVESKDVLVNVTEENGMLRQVPGMMVLYTDGYYDLAGVGLYIAVGDAGYEIIVGGPGSINLYHITEEYPDPRGEPIKVYGIGLDNLPAVMDEPMKIIRSVSVTTK